MLSLPDLATFRPGPLSLRRLGQLAWDRFRRRPAFLRRFTLRDGRVLLATFEGDAPGEILVRPYWPDAAGRRPLLFLPTSELVRMEGRFGRGRRQVGVGVIGAAVGTAIAIGLRLLAGPGGAPWGVVLVGGSLLGLAGGAVVVFVAQRHRWLCAWQALPVPAAQRPLGSRLT